MPPSSVPNHHCTVVAINGQGVLIRGASGSGKSSVALGLIDVGRARGLDVQLVCDDQAILENNGSSLLATAPEVIKGKIEVAGFGILEMPNLDSIEISLVCEIVADAYMDRMPEPQSTNLLGITLDLIHLPKRHEQQAVRIVLAYLEKNRH